MKRIVPILLLGLVGVAVTSCKEEKKPVDIVAKVPVEPKKPSGPQKREPFTTSEVVDWHGGKYTVKIERVPDSTLVSDASGQKYYDNRITLRILRADGSIFVDKTYRKSDFFAAVNNKFSTDGVLLGMAFDRVKDGQLAFGASIGDPNPDSDDFVPISITIDEMGKATISEGTLGAEED